MKHKIISYFYYLYQSTKY